MSVRIITPGLPVYPRAYSICTLVTNWAEYAEMKASFEAKGFTETDCEYLAVDNTHGNSADAFEGINAFMAQAQGRNVILVHQDVVLIDHGRPELEQRLAELDTLDPHWAIAGNAGGIRIKKMAKRFINGRGQLESEGTVPAQVQALDENFIVAKAGLGLGVSRRLSGFHFYGLELCQQADARGYTAYVIDFILQHKSFGNMDTRFYEAMQRIKRELVYRARPGYWQTTVVRFYTSGSVWLTWLLNTKPALFIARQYFKWTN